MLGFGGSSLIAAVAVTISALISTTDATFEQTCADLLSNLEIENATVSLVDFVPAGTNVTVPVPDPACDGPEFEIPFDLCRVSLNVSTSSRSGFRMEAWLPRNWTGRYLSTGNGGIGGCIAFEDMKYAASLGFATTGSNNGHDGQNGTTFLNNDDVLADFGWRSLHTSAVVGKEITNTFYKKPHKKAYYLGCSTGGRQGFKTAQEFPEDFDGIVAGAPAFNWNNLISWSGSFYSLINASPDGFPLNATWGAIDAEILAQCDSLDGAPDGIIEDSSLCKFKPERLICPRDSANRSACLTGKQAETIRTIFSPLHGVNGSLIYPGYDPSPAFLEAIYDRYSRAQHVYTDHWFKYAVYNDPHLETAVITPEEAAYAWALNPGDLNTWSGDLSGVASRGAKVLHYHGLADSVIANSISNAYYEHVSRTMELPPSSLDEFYRLFRISGMAHCSGGPGANVIGNKPDPASLDPEENVLTAMVRWVEEGVAPETVTGTAFVDDQTRVVNFKRRHCRYPYRNVYRGDGDGKDTEGWECIL